EVAVAVEAGPAQRQLCALLLAQQHIRPDTVQLRLRYEWADLGLRLEAAAEAHRFRRVHQRRHELVMDALVHEQPGPRRAHLTAGTPDRRCGRLDRRRDVGVRENDERALSTEFETHPLDLLGS